MSRTSGVSPDVFRVTVRRRPSNCIWDSPERHRSTRLTGLHCVKRICARGSRRDSGQLLRCGRDEIDDLTRKRGASGNGRWPTAANSACPPARHPIQSSGCDENRRTHGDRPRRVELAERHNGGQASQSGAEQIGAIQPVCPMRISRQRRGNREPREQKRDRDGDVVSEQSSEKRQRLVSRMPGSIGQGARITIEIGNVMPAAAAQ